ASSYLPLSPCSSHTSFFFYRCVAHRALHSFPTRRSSDLVGRLHEASVFVPERVLQQDLDRVRQAGDFRKSGRFERRQAVDLDARSEEHTSELQSPYDLVCRLLLEKKK